MNDFQVSGLFIYPIKSCKGVSLDSSIIDSRGLLYDRRWMLIDEKNRFISQREIPILSKLEMNLNENGLEVSFENDHLLIPFLTEPETNANMIENVIIWNDTCIAKVYDEITNSWFSKKIGKKCRLVYMPDESIRQVDPEYAPPGQITAFTDGYPILIVGQASINLLNDKLVTPVSIHRFRPNIVFTGGPPHTEDEFKKIEINGVILECVKLSRRCNVINIDQETAIASDEPTKTLTGYRFIDKRILFGNNTLVRKTGKIKIGDILYQI